MDIPFNNDIVPVLEDVDVPSFYRLSSEVVDKPSTIDDGRQDYFVTSSSSPSPSPSSHSNYQSNTLNGAGESWWLPNWSNLQDGRDFSVSQGDELLAMSLCVAGGVSDSELEAQGDVDEGFDEEFEEKDLNESDNSSRHHQAYPIEDLDPKEVQQLLGEDLRLEDFDLGVDVLDSGEQTRAIIPPVTLASSPMSRTTFPDRVLSTSPTPSLDVHTQALQRNRWNMAGDSYAASSPVSGSGSETCMENNQEVLVGTEEYSEDQLAMLVSACGVDRNQPSYDPAPLMDLSETIALASANPLMASEQTNTDLQSMLQFVNGSGQLPFLAPTTSTDPSLMPTSMGHMTSQVLMDSSSIFSNLNFTNLNNDLSSNSSTYRHPSPAASPLSPASTHYAPSPLSPASTYHTPSTPPSPSPSVDQDKITAEEQSIIDIPWYQFRKILDDSSVPDTKKDDMKNIRRKGKNKAAAKVCRQKKMRNMKGLEQEIQELKSTKQLVTFRNRSLEREIAQLKKKCQQRCR